MIKRAYIQMSTPEHPSGGVSSARKRANGQACSPVLYSSISKSFYLMCAELREVSHEAKQMGLRRDSTHNGRDGKKLNWIDKASHENRTAIFQERRLEQIADQALARERKLVAN